MTKAYRFTASELNVLAQTLITKCQRDGNLTFDGHRKTSAEVDNEESARRLANRIYRTLSDATPEEILALLDTYDLLHRIGYGCQPDAEYIRRQNARLLTAHRAGQLILPDRRLRRLEVAVSR